MDEAGRVNVSTNVDPNQLLGPTDIQESLEVPKGDVGEVGGDILQVLQDRVEDAVKVSVGKSDVSELYVMIGSGLPCYYRKSVA